MAKIVVFDSGLGSLSIIKEIQKIGKNDIIYFADQKNYPYGVKSQAQLSTIIKKTINLLEEKFLPVWIHNAYKINGCMFKKIKHTTHIGKKLKLKRLDIENILMS